VWSSDRDITFDGYTANLAESTNDHLDKMAILLDENTIGIIVANAGSTNGNPLDVINSITVTIDNTFTRFTDNHGSNYIPQEPSI
jgi:hypothetical protein